MAEELITVEVAYASVSKQVVLQLHIPNQTTVSQAIQLSGILSQFPEIDLQKQKTGIFGQLVNLDQTVCKGDRIEIYRPLKTDPMDARRQKAKYS